MSLATFKKKSINSASTATSISGKKTGKKWIYQGPYGSKDTLASTIYFDSITPHDNAGFSINGSNNRIISVGKSMKFSKSGTPFRGQYPMGTGGTGGKYPVNIVYNMPDVKAEIEGNDNYVKPSVLSTKGMLERRYRWINSGQYPNNWVQPVYTGNQTDTASQGQYIQTLAAANDCHDDVNNTEKYVNYFISCGPNDCHKTPALGYKMVLQMSNAPYTKTIHRPRDSSQHTLKIQRQCQNPTGSQKPFPYRVQNGTGILRGGTSVTNVGSACNTTPIFLSPPKWYTTSKPTTDIEPNNNILLQNYVSSFLDGNN